MEETQFNVIEIFDSIDGEGKRTGELTTFIRLSGCNLRCSYCDTSYAQRFNEGIIMTISEILEECKQYNNKNITLTGGEPLARIFIEDLIKELSINNFNVNIETNGSKILYTIPRYKNVFYTMDYKCPSSLVEKEMILENLEFLDKDDVLKFVVGNEEDLNKCKEILQNYNIKAQVYISPVFNNIKPIEIVEYMKKNKNIFNKARIQVQLHKIIWNPDERGV